MNSRDTDNLSQHVQALRTIVGERGLVFGADAAPYERGARFDVGKAAFVLRPASTEEVSKVVRYCVLNAIHLVPQAGNTGVVAGSTPDQTGLQAVLSVDRLNKGIAIDRDNRSVRVEAGVLLSDLNAALEPEGLFFPIDLGSNPRLGGMLATNTGGARFLKYGDVRRNTLGLTVVLADANGTILQFGRGLRKDNTGVDWKHVFIGTCGAFGIITECVLNVERLPQQSATALLVPDGSDKIMRLLQVLEDRFGSDLTAFEGMSKNAIEAALDHVSSLRNPFPRGEVPEFVILLEITSSRPPWQGKESLDVEMTEALEEIWELDDALLADAFMGPSHDLWALRHAISEGVKSKGILFAFDLAFRRGDLIPFCDRIKSELPTRFPDVSACEFGHIGDGAMHFNLVALRDGTTARNADVHKRLRDWVYEVAVEEFNGSFSAEHAIGRKNQTYYEKYTPDIVKEMAKRLKEITSPAGLSAVHFD